jgi:hypothetical protein
MSCSSVSGHTEAPAEAEGDARTPGGRRKFPGLPDLDRALSHFFTSAKFKLRKMSNGPTQNPYKRAENEGGVR